MGLAVTVGIARTKVLAKMASRAGKPDGLLLIEPEREAEFLRPLPVEALWGVGFATAEKLRAHGISTIGELERRDEAELAMFLGGHAARHLHAIANRRDPRRVRRGRPGARSAPSRPSPEAGGRDPISTRCW